MQKLSGIIEKTFYYRAVLVMYTIIFVIVAFTTLLSGCANMEKSVLANEPQGNFLMDHSYQFVDSTKTFTDLEKRGFTLMKEPVAHPGIRSRFIGFSEMGYPHKQYLEFIEIQNKATFAKSNTGEIQIESTGIGFKVMANIQSEAQRVKENLSDHQVIEFHRNFNWQENSSDLLAGWDFINVRPPIINEISFFGVYYQSTSQLKRVTHKNSSLGIIGVIIDGTGSQLAKMAKFAHQKIKNNVVSNQHGFHMIPYTAFKDRHRFLKEKVGAYKAVILKIDKRHLFEEYAKPDYEFELYGQTFYGIRLPKKGWDILATTSDEFVSKISPRGYQP